MPRFISPPESKRAVNRAGERIAAGVNADADIALIDQWRSAHAYALNTFQIFFKRRIARSNLAIEFSQRLKRRNTIIDKLRRRDGAGNKLVGDVTSMQDFAGCRLIFEDIKDLNEFRGQLNSVVGRRNIRHRLKHEDNIDKYDYIERPKFSGYRGVHEVFRHEPRLHRKGDDHAAPWRGLFCEVQYRTKIQHTWATALEISDFLDGQRTKFALPNENVSERLLFFSLSSELLARAYEDCCKSHLQLTDKSLIEKINSLDDTLGILERLSTMRTFDGADKLKRHNVLNIKLDADGDMMLEVLNFANSGDAIAKAGELEKSHESLNAVYVSSDKPSELRRAYKNYFNDTNDFVELLYNALNR